MTSKSKTAAPIWFSRDYWDRPASATMGSPNPSVIYEAVGQTLSSWESVESVLASWFVSITTNNSRDEMTKLLTERAYGSIESNSGRRKALDAVAEVYFNKEWKNPVVKRPYDQLMENIRRASQRRDDIAHGYVMAISTGVMVLRKKEDRGKPHPAEHSTNHGFFLWPAEYHNSRTDAFISEEARKARDLLAMNRAHYRYRHTDILLFENKFGELSNAISAFFKSAVKIDGELNLTEIQRVCTEYAKTQ